jgi:RNA polymerase sigma-B factor
VTMNTSSVDASTESKRRDLLQAYRRDGDLAARDRLIADLLPFARSLARRYAGKGEDIEDLVQVASVGLVKAIDNFDLDRDSRILSYVFPTVIGELKRHFRDRVWSVTVPRGLKELNQLLSRRLEELTATLGRSPTIAELAEATKQGEEQVLEALEVGHAYKTRSLSSSADADADSEVERLDALMSEEAGYETSENRALLATGLKALEDRERLILHLRFFEGLTQSQIARQVGISQMHVSRLIRRALEELEAEIEGES